MLKKDFGYKFEPPLAPSFNNIHEKIALDLFQKYLKKYTFINSVISLI